MTILLSHQSLLNHGIPSHPENSTRLQAILESISKGPYKQLLDLSASRLATHGELAKVHDPAYVKHVFSFDGTTAAIDQETILTPGSVNAARLAAGIGLEIVEKVWEGKAPNGFALVRPPGHHACSDTGMGFCIFNNIAVAARKALELGAKRILILDWDVHHGNGTQEIFYEDDRVLLIDFHQDNLFPQGSGLLKEKGAGKGKGFTVNIPLPEGCRDADYLYAFDQLVKPLAHRYRPELILVSAGFDAHESDPLAFMKLTTEGYGHLTAKINSLAQELCSGKIAFFLEGGYNPYWLAKNVLECIKTLNETSVSTSLEEYMPSSKVLETLIKEIYEYHFDRGQ